MSIQGLNFQPLHVPFSGGLNTKGDPRAQQPPALDICKNVRFDNIGGLETSLPFAALGSNILGGGTISGARRLVPNGNELLMFTKDSLYSWDARDTAWVLKGTHLAVATTETDVFDDPLDQYDADRAEMGNVVVYAWTEGANVYVAALDKTTGDVIALPTAMTGTAPSRPRLVALSTKIVLFYAVTVAGNPNLVALAIDPANVATSLAAATTTVLSTGGGQNFQNQYDVMRAPGTDTAIVAGNTGGAVYLIASVTSALALVNANKARNSGPIAVACHPDGLHVQIVRANGAGVIHGDYLTIAGLADVTINQVIDGGHAMSLTYLTASYRSVQNGGHYRCYAFFNDAAGTENIYSNWVDDSGALGTSAILLTVAIDIVSRAFDYNGSIYFWALFSQTSTFAGGNAAGYRAQLQNTYFLYRDDGTYHAVAADGVAGAIPTLGLLPGVVLTAGTTTFSWAGLRKRVIPIATSQLSLTTARTPRDITFSFDSNSARAAVRLGQSIYVAASEVLVYDGARLVECGYHVYPWTFAATDSAAGNLAAGIYAYKMTWRWTNAKGETDRSTTATVGTVTMGASRKANIANASSPGLSLGITKKTAFRPAAEIWRTTVNPTPLTPFYLATSPDPNNATNPNRYLSSLSPPSFDDNLADASLSVLQNNPENGATLPNLAPPPASIILATDDRIFLAGVAGDPDRVWYSKQRNAGEVAAFNDALVIPVPHPGGAITGLAYHNETLIVFRQRATYQLPGTGFDNLGGGSNFGPARILSTDIGAVTMDSIVQFEHGTFFKSDRGYFVLDHQLGFDYVGAPVATYDAEVPLAAHAMTGVHEIRVLTANRLLFWDTLTGQWGERAISDGVHACLWNGVYYYLADAGPKQEQATWTNLTYGFDVETAWIKPGGDLQLRTVVDRIQILGEWRSAFKLRVRIARNYQSDGAGGWAYFEDFLWTAGPPVVGGPLQLRHNPKYRACEAIKVRLTAVATDGTSAPTGEAARLTALAIWAAPESGLYANLPGAQRA